MVEYPEAKKIAELVAQAGSILVIQADNPDADSLASALALEHILEEAGKQITLYCGVDLPSYLSYLPGSDRVSSSLPNNFDLSIIVDTSSIALLEQLEKQGAKGWLAAKPCIILDHHASQPTIDFASVVCNHPAVATAEIIYELALQLDWPLNLDAKKLLAMAILSDSLGLVSEATTYRSVEIIAELVKAGVKLSEIENLRRESMRRDPELIHYKGRLLERVEFHGAIAIVTIPWEEIEKFSPLYNPPMLVLDDMRLAKGTAVAVAFKLYNDGKITAKIRCNYGSAIADKLAEHFGGGGHPYAAGFKLTDGRSYEEIKNETIRTASELLETPAKADA
ncbi:MAG TPA: DHH family phosphoesterase [Candidatus Nitrosopolaris sp.]|nr:DHH family phosphoesterase [Candidatus Nitrosopolaris sp.]